MSCLPGVPLDTVWDQLCAADRDRLAGHPGETIAALHQPPPRRAGSPARAPPQHGVADAWVSQVRPRSRVDRDGNRRTRRHRPCCRPSRSARPHLGVLKTAAVPDSANLTRRRSTIDQRRKSSCRVCRHRTRTGNIACSRANRDLLSGQ